MINLLQSQRYRQKGRFAVEKKIIPRFFELKPRKLLLIKGKCVMMGAEKN
jgi:hypothetical protein